MPASEPLENKFSILLDDVLLELLILYEMEPEEDKNHVQISESLGAAADALAEVAACYGCESTPENHERYLLTFVRQNRCKTTHNAVDV